MLFWVIPLIIVIASAVMMLVIALKHVREVAAIDPKSDPKHQRRSKKQELFAKRIERMGGTHAKQFGRMIHRLGRIIKRITKGVYRKAQAMDRHYKRLQNDSGLGPGGTHESRKRLIEEAESLMSKEAYQAAEQRLIEYISLDPKQSDVYERLGIVYIKTRQYDQAWETFQHAHRLAPEDASILVYLGELAMRDGKIKDAVELFRKAVKLKPTNPKYLDFLIESSILAGDSKLAGEGLYFLKEANPDNKKIEEFDARIAQM
jgi:Flp pilus assembly protein TadD